METATETNETAAPDPTPAPAPLSYAQLFVALCSAIPPGLSFCLDAETWNHPAAHVRATTTWKVWVGTSPESVMFEAPSSAELLGKVRERFGDQAIEIAPACVQAVGDISW